MCSQISTRDTLDKLLKILHFQFPVSQIDLFPKMFLSTSQTHLNCYLSKNSPVLVYHAKLVHNRFIRSYLKKQNTPQLPTICTGIYLNTVSFSLYLLSIFLNFKHHQKILKHIALQIYFSNKYVLDTHIIKTRISQSQNINRNTIH